MKKNFNSAVCLWSGFKTDEIAAIWMNSVFSVHKYKTNVRKKINAQEGADIIAFLSEKLSITIDFTLNYKLFLSNTSDYQYFNFQYYKNIIVVLPMVSEREFLIFASYNSVAKQLLFLMIIYGL